MPRKRTVGNSAASARPRSTSRLVATSPGCAPLKEAYKRAEALKPKSWATIEKVFLRGMEGLDQNIASGSAAMRDLQNGKGDFFNDLLALIRENCAGVQLYSREGVPEWISPRHKLDVAFPSSGPIEFVLEANAVGMPKHPDSPKRRRLPQPDGGWRAAD